MALKIYPLEVKITDAVHYPLTRTQAFLLFNSYFHAHFSLYFYLVSTLQILDTYQEDLSP